LRRRLKSKLHTKLTPFAEGAGICGAGDLLAALRAIFQRWLRWIDPQLRGRFWLSYFLYHSTDRPDDEPKHNSHDRQDSDVHGLKNIGHFQAPFVQEANRAEYSSRDSNVLLRIGLTFRAHRSNMTLDVGGTRHEASRNLWCGGMIPDRKMIFDTGSAG
jgi:hypothetical protein